jgi:hypothetical protein
MGKLETNAAAVVKPSILDDLCAVKQSKDKVAEHIRIMLIAPSGEGKTVCAVSIDPACPKELPAKEMTELSRTLVIEMDQGGLDSLYGLNLSVQCIDLSQVPHDMLGVACMRALDTASKMADDGLIDNVVIDGLTTQNHILLKEHSKKAKLNKWDAIMNDNMEFFNKARQLRANVVFCAHGKVANIMASDKDPNVQVVGEAKLAAKGIDVGDVTLNVYGQGADFYINNGSLIMPVVKEKKAGKSRWVVKTRDAGRLFSKCRYPHLPSVMPAHLATVIEKIKEGLTA